MLAVIQTGGKQYKVSEKSVLDVEKLEAKEGENIEFVNVLLVASEDGATVKVGSPFVEGAKVVAKVLKQFRDKKVTVIKFKSKVHYKRKRGHRQSKTKLEILSIAA